MKYNLQNATEIQQVFFGCFDPELSIIRMAALPLVDLAVKQPYGNMHIYELVRISLSQSFCAGKLHE